MQKYMDIYAEILLKDCLKIKKGEPLVIKAPIENYEFLRIINAKALALGVKDIKFILNDAYISHDQAQKLKKEDLEKSDWWSVKAYEEYAKKNAAYLSFVSEYPGLMSDINTKLLTELQLKNIKETPTFEKKRNKNELSWCIAALPNQNWADKIYPNEKDNLKKLWKTILDICLITKKEPRKALKEKLAKTAKRAQKLNKLNLRSLKYTNSLGTDLTIELPDEYVFHSTEMILVDGRKIIPNMPSEEVYTSPNFKKTNGIVYASKPLIHDGKKVDNFYLEFKDGKVVNFDAKEGKDVLKSIINFDKNSCYLGEIALVDYDSPISNTNLLFYTTLYDENASCHLALGQSFSDCLKNGVNKSKKELEQAGLNQSKTHVDFMIGTKDLKIVGITKTNKEVIIFDKGNCVL